MPFTLYCEPLIHFVFQSNGHVTECSLFLWRMSIMIMYCCCTGLVGTCQTGRGVKVSATNGVCHLPIARSKAGKRAGRACNAAMNCNLMDRDRQRLAARDIAGSAGQSLQGFSAAQHALHAVDVQIADGRRPGHTHVVAVEPTAQE